MATLISDASIQIDPIVITDMKFEANERNASTIDINADTPSSTDPRLKSKIEQLKINDSVFGPLQIGDISITRVSLHALGARLTATL